MDLFRQSDEVGVDLMVDLEGKHNASPYKAGRTAVNQTYVD